ncbi:MAG: response regulator [Alphaproteobacteria bacterium]|jgi:CheY-like chemotaxis protein|nr:response regulator [Alphaproteobacteria bacterium]
MIPCCFHPTRVVVIDDNSEFLHNLNQNLLKEYASYHYFKNPQKALHFLNDVYQPDPFPNRYIKTLDEDKWEHRSLDVNIWDTYLEVYRPQRFEEISVVIVDYSMPGMSGLEICKKIKDPNIQKILLTGIADESLAIHAFNEGLIQAYVRKQDFHMSDLLNEAVEKAQWRYFNRFSEITLKAIAIADSENQAIADSKFQAFFKSLLKRYKFREAYLCEAMGSYLFLTKEGTAYGLVVRNEDEVELYAESAEMKQVKRSLVQELQDGKKMMFHHNRYSSLAPPGKEEWENHLYPSRPFHGALETYYYAFGPGMFNIDPARVLSFERYAEDRRFEVHS